MMVKIVVHMHVHASISMCVRVYIMHASISMCVHVYIMHASISADKSVISFMMENRKSEI